MTGAELAGPTDGSDAPADPDALIQYLVDKIGRLQPEAGSKLLAKIAQRDLTLAQRIKALPAFTAVHGKRAYNIASREFVRKSCDAILAWPDPLSLDERIGLFPIAVLRGPTYFENRRYVVAARLAGGQPGLPSQLLLKYARSGTGQHKYPLYVRLVALNALLAAQPERLRDGTTAQLVREIYSKLIPLRSKKEPHNIWAQQYAALAPAGFAMLSEDERHFANAIAHLYRANELVLARTGRSRSFSATESWRLSIHCAKPGCSCAGAKPAEEKEKYEKLSAQLVGRLNRSLPDIREHVEIAYAHAKKIRDRRQRATKPGQCPRASGFDVEGLALREGRLSGAWFLHREWEEALRNEAEVVKRREPALRLTKVDGLRQAAKRDCHFTTHPTCGLVLPTVP